VRRLDVVFLVKKRLFHGKFSKFRYETIHADNGSRIPAKFAEIDKVEMTKPARGSLFITKK